MGKLKRILSLCTLAVFCVMSLPLNAVTAESCLHGDMNSDGIVNITDLVMLKSCITDDEEKSPQLLAAADINDDGTADAADIELLLKYLFGEISQMTEHEFITESELIPSAASITTSCTQSVGKAAALTVFAEFNDAHYKSEKLSAEELKEEMFGEGKTMYPFESISAYLERSSYGNFTVSGDVAYCSLNASIRDYSNTPADREKLVIDILKSLDDIYDYSDFDEDRDGDIDILCITLPLENADSNVQDFWYGATHTWYYNENFSIDGVHVGQFIGNDVMPYTNDMYYFKQTFLHELGHCMGLSDYYKYASEDYEGLKGNAGYCRMDDSIGDYCTFSKLMLGWLREDEVQIYDTESGGSQKFTLDDSGVKGSCVIIPAAGWDGSFTSEYFLIEYLSDAGNNMDVRNFMGGWWSDEMFSGFRIMHVDAELFTDFWGRTDFKYENYSEKYNGDDKQRIVRLVNNEKKGFYKAGDTADNLLSYGNSGYEEINSGYTVYFTEESDGKYSVEISKS